MVTPNSGKTGCLAAAWTLIAYCCRLAPMALSAVWLQIKSHPQLHLAWCCLGVIGSLLIYGVYQEKLMTVPYGSGADKERFTYSLFLVLCNRLFTGIVAVLNMVVEDKLSTEIKPIAPIYAYAAVSLSNVLATTCQYEALKYVSMPVQTLGKCAKMFPVMIWGMLMLGKKYGFKDYTAATFITLGCTGFFLTGDITSKHSRHHGNSDSIYGLALMVGYLAFDGFTSTFQDKLFKGYQMTTHNQLFYTVVFSILFSITGLLSSNQLVAAIGFVTRHPDAFMNAVLLSAAATVGANFISYTIKSFGSLLFATIMTVRQFLTVLLSCLLFVHPLSAGQWLSAAVVFGTLLHRNLTKTEKPKNKPVTPDAEWQHKPGFTGPPPN